jgi:hypothetical protein
LAKKKLFSTLYASGWPELALIRDNGWASQGSKRGLQPGESVSAMRGQRSSHPHVEQSIFHVLHPSAAPAPGLPTKHSGLNGRVARVVTTAIVEGLGTAGGMTGEYRVFDAPWRFEPDEISTPTQF